MPVSKTLLQQPIGCNPFHGWQKYPILFKLLIKRELIREFINEVLLINLIIYKYYNLILNYYLKYFDFSSKNFIHFAAAKDDFIDYLLVAVHYFG